MQITALADIQFLSVIGVSPHQVGAEEEGVCVGTFG